MVNLDYNQERGETMDKKAHIAKIVDETIDSALTFSPRSFNYAMSEAEYYLDSMLRQRPHKDLDE